MITDLAKELNKFRDKLGKESGVSLIEVAAALPLGALVLVLLAIAISNFLITYEETRLYVQLQEELFNAVESIRYGFAKAGVTEMVGLIGLLSAENVVIRPDRQAITIKPLVIIQGSNEDLYSADFYLESGELKTSARYNTLYYQNERVFPTGNRLIGGEKQFRITDLRFTPEKYYYNDIYILGIDIEARVRFRARSSGQSVEEDLRINTRTINYNTSVFLGNS